MTDALTLLALRAYYAEWKQHSADPQDPIDFHVNFTSEKFEAWRDNHPVNIPNVDPNGKPAAKLPHTTSWTRAPTTKRYGKPVATTNPSTPRMTASTTKPGNVQATTPTISETKPIGKEDVDEGGVDGADERLFVEDEIDKPTLWMTGSGVRNDDDEDDDDVEQLRPDPSCPATDSGQFPFQGSKEQGPTYRSNLLLDIRKVTMPDFGPTDMMEVDEGSDKNTKADNKPSQ